ncbi:hypothetical protein [Halalkalicoccus jeotgali]|uniref:Uncharacterized protein n=1 Tax=Halalkalicoccus jeotgali (strain DSM 18796 / CECT 7217 / JCM 14584 / KCTC 4019 / B3) TaxID=795797 RepID=D8J4E1_HALJB|nr:hypothetical protein [Halalkalicoccus jeotgali]ADJ13503.1 hypothetical protein HacjB3_00550 [Halalkalicoccus jeotgali B3]ELY33022.1 hypothetical protein C497_18782 [Halalkalicoccus jeotgali B3]
MLSDSRVTLLTKLLVVGLLAVSLVSAYLISRRSGPVAALPSLIGVYITLTLAVGVFATSLLDPRFQVAFAFGIVMVGVSMYVTESALVGALFVVVGLFWLGTKGRELT